MSHEQQTQPESNTEGAREEEQSIPHPASETWSIAASLEAEDAASSALPEQPVGAEQVRGHQPETPGPAESSEMETGTQPEMAPPEPSSELPAPDAGPQAPVHAPPREEGELEELTLPSSISSLEPLPDGSVAGPEERLRVEKLLAVRGRVNHYLATWLGEDGATVPVELMEAPSDHAPLRSEAEVLSQVRYSMLPKLFATWEQEGRRYLAVERLEGSTLQQALEDGLGAEQAASFVLQLTQVLRRLQQAGWALVGLTPADVLLGQPIRLTNVGAAVHIGQEPPHALQVPGYSAPEVAHRAVVTGKEDVYTLGAVLYRALVGEPVPEQGPELSTLSTATQTPGAPQLLAPALAPVSERIDLEGFYHRLLAFKRRLALAPLTLQVASGTSVGLNPTRLVNEDACTHLQWSIAHEEGVSHRAVLCVVDGMGGMEAGDVASRAAVQAVLARATAYSAAQAHHEQAAGEGQNAPLSEDALDPAVLVKEAATSVHAAARGRQVGATITVVVIDEGKLTLAHVGDTRAYLLHDGVLTQLTQDHSLVAAMVASGLLTKEQARGHPDSNKVLRSLGGQRSLPDDYIDDLAVAYGEQLLHLREGDQLLLCSDGIWGTVADDQLRDILTHAPDCETAVREGIQHALKGGSPDNATLIVARCVVTPAT